MLLKNCSGAFADLVDNVRQRLRHYMCARVYVHACACVCAFVRECVCNMLICSLFFDL